MRQRRYRAFDLAFELAVELAFNVSPYSAAHPAVLCVGDFGDVGVAFFWFLFLARRRVSRNLPPGNPRPAVGKLTREGESLASDPIDSHSSTKTHIPFDPFRITEYY